MAYKKCQHPAHGLLKAYREEQGCLKCGGNEKTGYYHLNPGRACFRLSAIPADATMEDVAQEARKCIILCRDHALAFREGAIDLYDLGLHVANPPLPALPPQPREEAAPRLVVAIAC